MKKTLLSVAVIAATVSVAHAEPAAWFAGNIGGDASDGSWDAMPTSGVTLEGNAYILNDAEHFKFTADESKSVSSSQNLVFSSSVAFKYAYGDFPEIDEGDQAGVTVYRDKTTTNFYVVGKVDETNGWKNSSISAPANLDDEVSVTIMVTNGIDGTHAVYSIGNPASTFDTLIVTPSAFSIVDYSGCGVIKALTGQLIALGIIVPGYRDPIPEGATLNAWLTANNMTAEGLKDTSPQLNGNTAYENCVLGIDNDAKLVANAADTSAAKITYGIASTPMPGINIQYKLMKKAPADAEASQVDASASPSFEQAVGDGLYHISAEIALSPSGTKSIASEKVGVMQVDSTKVTEYIAVPWTAFGGAAGIAPTALVKASGLSANDTLEVYDAVNGDWEGYRWDGEKWVAATGEKHVTALTRGMAVKLTRANTENNVYLVGGAPDGAVETTLQNNKWNLVANPGFGAFTIGSTKLGTSTKDAVMVAGESVFTQYTCRNGVWAKIVPVVENGIQTNTRVEENMTVPQGTGFFFVNESGKGAINW